MEGHFGGRAVMEERTIVVKWFLGICKRWARELAKPTHTTIANSRNKFEIILHYLI